MDKFAITRLNATTFGLYDYFGEGSPDTIIGLDINKLSQQPTLSLTREDLSRNDIPYEDIGFRNMYIADQLPSLV